MREKYSKTTSRIFVLWSRRRQSPEALHIIPSSETCKMTCNVLHIKIKICLFVPYTNSHFWTDPNQTLHTSPPSSERDCSVCMIRKCWTFFYLFDLLRRERVQNPGHKMAADVRHFRDSAISVILAGVSVTSRKWRFSRRHLPRVIRDSVISVILAGVNVMSRKWRCCRQHLPRVIRDGVLCMILAGVSVTTRKWRCSRRHLRVLIGSVVHYGQCIKNAVKWAECMCVKVETL
jgi:hypothetical protein